MSQSSNYNCISADCARVVYREYLPPVVRWRYPNEEWQEIVADDYAIETNANGFSGGQCEGNTYSVVVETLVTDANGQTSTGTSSMFAVGRVADVFIFQPESGNDRRYFLIVVHNSPTDPITKVLATYGAQNISVEIISINIYRVDGQPDNCDECTFTAYKIGAIVHQETRDICPEIEKLPCRLSEISKEIKIDKTPFLSAIEVTQLDNDAERIKGVPFPLQGVGKAPDECWNIYRNEIFDPFPSGDADDPNEPVFGDYIDQICSVTGCPPPDYEVICDCNEQCPNGTCGVFCGEYLCCYDSTGRAVKSIHYSDIPDFGIPDNTVGINDLGGNFA